MIEIDTVPNGASVTLLDFGFLQRPATGAALSRIDRPGNRWRIEFSFPVMRTADAQPLLADLAAGKSEGVRVPYPLQYVDQGAPGSPVVDGAIVGGSILPVRGLTPGYVCKKGYWMTVVDADGQQYLHHAKATVAADGSGDAVLSIHPLLRCALEDGSIVNLSEPTVEGVIDGDISITLENGGLVSNIGFTLEEAA